MNSKEIARELWCAHELDTLKGIDLVAAAIDAAVAAERERCAKICDDMSGWRDWAELKHPNFPGAPCEAGAAADWLAAVIRSATPDETRGGK